MPSEIYYAPEADKKQLTEKERKKEVAKKLAFSKEKKTILERMSNKKELEFLKSLVERGLITVDSAAAITAAESISPEEVAEIFAKIDEIENVPHIESILPERLRLTKDEYAQAIETPEARTNALSKLDQALQYLYDSHHADGFSPMSFFFSTFLMLSKNLVKVQEATIDIKRSFR
jgi:hypothetical protein